jgi:acetolactate synthase-1/2/3 large subunit
MDQSTTQSLSPAASPPAPITQKGGAFLARTLHEYGITHVFFVDAIARHMLAHAETHGINRVLTHSEKAAAYMADGYARASGRPAVCMAQSVGAANLASGLQDAFFANSPVIAITGRHMAEKQYRHAYQELPHEPLFTPVTKFTGRIETPLQLAHLTRHAFRLATSGVTGPVHLDMSGHTGDVIDMGEINAAIVIDERYKRVPAYRSPPEPRSLQLLADAINAAAAPVLVIGQGVCWSGAQQAVVQLAHGQQLPVVCGLDAKTTMADVPDLDMGVTGTYGTDSANRLLAEADLAVFIGCDVGDQLSSNWKLPLPGTRTAQIGIDADDLGLNLPGCLTVLADPLLAIEQLEPLLRARDRSAWLARARALKDTWITEHAAQCASDASPVRPERLCAEIGRWLPADAVLVADTGHASQWTGQLLNFRHSSQTFLRAVGSLGWAYPASLGAKAALPDRPVISFVGDAGFMYHLPELETAKRRSLHTITIVNNNGCLGQGRTNLTKLQIDGKAGPGMGDCFEFIQQDFAAIARSFGCVGIRVDHPSELRAALDQALKEEGPVVIDVHTEPTAAARTPWMP